MAGTRAGSELPLRVGDLLAAGVLGAGPGEVAVTDSTTVNLYRLASAALDARPDRRAIVIERSEFPTDRYIVEGLARERDLEIRWLDGDPIEGLAPDDISAQLDDGRRAADPVGGQLSIVGDRGHPRRHRRRARRRRARRCGTSRTPPARSRWTSTANGVDLAVGCTYKYLNGGPGAPAFLFVRRELQDELRPPIQGWFAQSDQFEMGPRFERHAGHRRLAGRDARRSSA